MKSSTILRGVCFLFFLLLTACAPKPILVGFSAELTGRQGELGVASRNGAELAVAQINANGGIDGRPIELVIADDQGDPETARQEDQKLIDQGVVAIIGHITSGQTAAVFEMMNQAKVVLISPTASSILFLGKDDYFYHLMPGNDMIARALARHIYNSGIREIACIYDLSNRAFTETLWQELAAEFLRIGGETTQSYSFTSGQTDLKALMAEISATNPEAVVYITSAVDAALLTQYGKQAGLKARLFSSTWAYTDELLEKGGRTVEGMDLVAMYHPSYPSETYQKFLRDYQDRFGKKPTLGASHSYEAVLVLAAALKKTGGRPDGLREALGQIQSLEGLLDPISFDINGDVRREIFIVRVENGQFVVVASIKP